MKKTLSLLLALLMVIAAVPTLGLGIAAEGETASAATSTYAIYSQDFESLDPSAGKSELLQALGWFVPSSKTGDDIADYSIVVSGEGESANKALRVSTKAPVGLRTESFVTIYSGDTMDLLRTGDFTLSYQLTYRDGTENYDGYSSIIYNYNGLDGALVDEDGTATYGLVAIRACGTGFNGVYYSVTSGATMSLLEELPNQSEYSMGNRFNATGQYPSLYARLFLDDPAEEAPDATLSGLDNFVNKTLNVRIEYSFLNGICVYINDILVSKPTETDTDKHANSTTWNDFVTRTDGSDIALLTKYGMVADIDNISITASTVGLTEEDRDIPELIITEIAPTGDGSDYWAEYIEICNPTDHAVDLSEYSLIYTNLTFDGDASDSISASRMNKYTNYVTFDSLLGKELRCTTNFYATAETLRALGESRYYLVDANTTLETGTRYKREGTNYVAASDGELIRFRYIEHWNERYKKENNYDENGNVMGGLYSTNTMLAPGACMLVYTILTGTEKCWKYGVNAGKNSTTISTDKSFRQFYKNRGLGSDLSIKVVAESKFNLADSESRRYLIGKTYDESGAEINYTKLYDTDMTSIVSYADYVSTLVSGKPGSADANDTSTLGNGGVHDGGYSGVYVYGVDASSDYRAGTLYVARNQVKSSNHVGRLAGYQQINIDMLKKSAQTALAITEIAPRTQNLLGEDCNAFSAMEVTNTSSSYVNLYDYAIVRNELGTGCSFGKSFTRTVELRAGNPVNKGVSNGAYYYFMEEHINNPDTCVLAPGETAVLWFVSEDAYKTYKKDDDFGVDYFRQYWVNMGSTQMAEKSADGEYAVKVIAVDGNVGESYNRDNASKVLDLSYTSSAIYGIAVANENVLSGSIATSDVISIAYLGTIATYFNLHTEEQESGGITYVFQVLDYLNIPANGSMHYIPCRAGAGACSGMARSLKVQYWNYDSSKPLYYDKSKGEQTFLVQLRTNYAMQTPDIGTVRGEEALALGLSMFYPVTDTEGNKTYYYYDALHTSVRTLQGAALNTTGTSAMLRFDNAVPSTVYNTLAATYGGEKLKVGMLIVESSRVSSMETFDKATLERASIPYTDVVGHVVARTANYVVLGSSMEVAAANYNTSYTAVGYLEVQLADGTTKTLWSSVSATGIVKDVATQAIADVQSASNDIYKYEVGIGFYSRYSAAERETLRRFSA